MRSVAELLRAEEQLALATVTPGERVALALALGARDLEAFRLAHEPPLAPVGATPRPRWPAPCGLPAPAKSSSTSSSAGRRGRLRCSSAPRRVRSKGSACRWPRWRTSFCSSSTLAGHRMRGTSSSSWQALAARRSSPKSMRRSGLCQRTRAGSGHASSDLVSRGLRLLRPPRGRRPRCRERAGRRLSRRVPLTRGHTLVVPRRHEAKYFALSAAEQTAMWRLVNTVRARVEGELHPDGYNLGVNVGQAAGQPGGPVHIPLPPRYAGGGDAPRGGIRRIIPARARYWEQPYAPPPPGGPNAARGPSAPPLDPR